MKNCSTRATLGQNEELLCQASLKRKNELRFEDFSGAKIKRWQLALPVREGGAGFGTLSLRHQSAYIGSWSLCLRPVVERLPDEGAETLVRALRLGDTMHPVAAKVLEAKSVLQALGVPDNKLLDWNNCAARAQQKVKARLSRAIGSTARQSLLRDLPVSRVCVSSCGAPGAGAFLLGSGSEASGTEFLDGVLLHSLAWRLGFPTVSPGQTRSIGCLRRLG